MCSLSVTLYFIAHFDFVKFVFRFLAFFWHLYRPSAKKISSLTVLLTLTGNDNIKLNFATSSSRHAWETVTVTYNPLRVRAVHESS